MPIIDKFESSEHRNNIAHFASIVNLANADGVINDKEEGIIKRFSQKLSITESEYDIILKNSRHYPIAPSNSLETRLELLFDLFNIIYADNHIETTEKILILKYAVGLGFASAKAEEIIEKSILIFEGKLDFEQYRSLIKN